MLALYHGRDLVLSPPAKPAEQFESIRYCPWIESLTHEHHWLSTHLQIEGSTISYDGYISSRYTGYFLDGRGIFSRNLFRLF